MRILYLLLKTVLQTNITNYASNGSIVFHAGAQIKGDKIVTSGGRVMAITSYGNTYNEALKKSYHSITKLHFDKMYYRKDLGFDL